MNDKWYSLSRTVTPTKAATDIFNEMARDGRSAVNLGQGREIEELNYLQTIYAQTRPSISSKYNATPQEFTDLCSDWLDRFMGIEASPANTFPMSGLGREGLDKVLHWTHKNSGFRENAKVLVPDTAWPVVDNLLDDYGLKSQTYDMNPDYIVSSIIASIRLDPDILAIYINSPHNPTGTVISHEQLAEIMDTLEVINETRPKERRISVILDNPYFHAAAQNTAADKPYLDCGFEDIFSADSATPWATVQSFSKAFGMASPGFSIVATHPDMAEGLNARFTRTSLLGFSENMYEALGTILKPENDPIVLGHFESLHDKYVANRKTLETELAPYVVDGAAGMTALLKLHEDIFTNRIVEDNDGNEFTLTNLDDVIEWLANKHDVVGVNNGVDAQGNLLLRLAAAAQPDVYERGIHSLKAGLETIKTAPRIDDPTPGTDQSSSPAP